MQKASKIIGCISVSGAHLGALNSFSLSIMIDCSRSCMLQVLEWGRILFLSTGGLVLVLRLSVSFFWRVTQSHTVASLRWLGRGGRWNGVPYPPAKRRRSLHQILLPLHHGWSKSLCRFGFEIHFWNSQRPQRTLLPPSLTYRFETASFQRTSCDALEES